MMTKTLPVAKEAKIPCTHAPKEMCDLCLVWTGVQAYAMEAKFWKVGTKWSVTCICHNHPTPFCVELSRKADAFDAIETAYKLVEGGGKRLECGCHLQGDVEETEKKMLLDFVRAFLKEFGEYSDVNAWTENMVARARRLVKLCGKR